MKSENSIEYINITLDNDKTIKVPKGTSYLSISQESNFKERALGVKKNNEILSLNDRAMEDENIEFFDARSIEGAKIYKAAVKFIFEVALKTVLPNSDIHYLHSVPGGMLGEIKYEKTLEIEDLSKIKREMANIIDQNEPFTRYNISKKDAIKFYKEAMTPEKAANVEIYDNIVTIYKLKCLIVLNTLSNLTSNI